jgi:AraC-like DNA-binding protein
MRIDIDVLARVIEQSGLRGHVYCRSLGRAPWGLDFDGDPDGGGLFHLVLSGACWLLHDGKRTQLVAGDVVLVPRGQRHALADDPRSRRIRLGEWLRGPGGEVGNATRTLGSASGAETEVLCGVYAHANHALRQPVLDLLPDWLHLRARGGRTSAELEATVSSLRAESAMGARGSSLIVSRLLDILFVQIVRAWADANPARAGWIGALQDPVLARALAALHSAPAQDWDVASLARRCGSSRATLARKFTAQVGQPPLAYLTQLRLDLAARTLATSRDGLAAVAASVGYSSEFALSRAFRRAFGQPPGAFRDAVLPADSITATPATEAR